MYVSEYNSQETSRTEQKPREALYACSPILEDSPCRIPICFTQIPKRPSIRVNTTKYTHCIPRQHFSLHLDLLSCLRNGAGQPRHKPKSLLTLCVKLRCYPMGPTFISFLCPTLEALATRHKASPAYIKERRARKRQGVLAFISCAISAQSNDVEKHKGRGDHFPSLPSLGCSFTSSQSLATPTVLTLSATLSGKDHPPLPTRS